MIIHIKPRAEDMSPICSVVLLNWNGGEFTIPCIQSLLVGTVKPDKIVVVDNASVDGSADKITATFPNVVMIRNETNRGFAGGNNQGIKYLLKQGVDYIWLLNNDTIVAADCLEKLMATAIQYSQATGFSAKIFYDDPSDRIWYAGAYRHRWHLGVKHLLKPILDESAVNGAVPVPFISGCCMVVPSWTWRQYGSFIEEYIGYSEDSEWCWRVTRAGGKLYYVPGAVLWHKLSASIRKNTGGGNRYATSPWACYFMYRNQIWTVRRHAKGFSRKLALSVNFCIIVKNIGIWLLEGKIDLVRSSIRGLTDGFLCDHKTTY